MHGGLVGKRQMPTVNPAPYASNTLRIVPRQDSCGSAPAPNRTGRAG